MWVYTKNVNEEILDLKEYVVAGEVKRLINQVSSAKVTLRNPEKIFTQPATGVAFHPMDPITIFMERVPGYPVQVFTGYLDTTPYYQMFPGTITLEASCTLKKLLYTYFQFAQPYTLNFLKHFGWNVKGNGTIGPEEGNVLEEQLKERLKAAGAGEEIKNTPNGVPFATSPGALTSNDGSFSKLLKALLYYIADWPDEKIYIEAVPATVPKLINALWTDFTTAGDQQELEQLETYWKALIGGSSQGSGGGEGNGSPVGKSGNTPEVGKATEIMTRIATRKHLPPAFVICTSLCECEFSQENITQEHGGAQGWFQFQFAGKSTDSPYPGSKSYTKEEAEDTSIATEAFCDAALLKLAEDSTYSQEGRWEEWARATQVSEGYPGWTTELAHAKELISKYPAGGIPLKEGLSEETSAEENQRGATEKKGKTGSGETTRIAAIEKEGDEITAKKYPYAWGGGHPSAGTPSIGEAGGPAGSSGVLGFDCAGSVAAMLVAGGYVAAGSPIGSSGTFGAYLQTAGFSSGPGSGSTSVTVYYNSVHAWMLVKNKGEERYFSTSDSNPGGGAGWRPGNDGESEGEYESMHLEKLTESYSGKPPALEGGSEQTASNEKGTGIINEATAASFLSQIAMPTSEERVKALIFGGQKALMNSQPLMPFVQQVCESSLRSFQSLPNGDFFGFYPDYFGEMGHRKPYWKIYDIEILEGGINLSDDNLVTHVFAVGNTNWPVDNSILNEVNAGVMTIFEAFTAGTRILFNPDQEAKDAALKPGISKSGNANEAIEFLKRYGARPIKMEYPMVNSTLYEALLAYQQFLLAWSRQFLTTFSFTFMPELFPGGKVGFPDHGLQMYIESVTHTWDLEGGFETFAQLSAPSVFQETSESTIQNASDLPKNMVDALIEPIRGEVAKQATAPKARPARPVKQIAPVPTTEERNKAFGGS